MPQPSGMIEQAAMTTNVVDVRVRKAWDDARDADQVIGMQLALTQQLARGVEKAA